MQFAFVKDVVWSCLRAMDAANVVGHAFNIANARPLTQAEVLDALFVAAGKDTPVIRVPGNGSPGQAATRWDRIFTLACTSICLP